MTFFQHTLFLIAIVATAVTAEIPSCRAMKQDTTQCDPYDTLFMKITQLKKGRASLRRRPVTDKKTSLEEKIRVKNGMTLHNLVFKYIRREERFYSRLEKKKGQQAERGIQKKAEKNPEQTSSKPKPYTPQKTVVLVPATKPIAAATSTVKKNTDDETQSPGEVILPVEAPVSPKIKQKGAGENPRAEYAVYRVKKGDSLLGIAKRFGVEARGLIGINQLHKGAALKAGQKLRIPLSQEDTDAIDNATYIVKKGDTLSRIAKHFGAKLSDLKKYNKVRKKSVIHVGQILVLPLPWKLVELKRVEERKRKAALKKKRERERLARIALKKAERARFLKLSKGLKHKLSVTATAYTSHRSQTDRTPFLAAWNNRIRPGMKIIAVSRDLIYKYGITNGKKVRISGLPGIYTVRDKMHRKWRRKIDIYMGTSRWRALRWGRRRVTLYY